MWRSNKLYSVIPELGSIPSSKQKGALRICTKLKGQDKELILKRKREKIKEKEKELFQARSPSLIGKGRGSYADYLTSTDWEIPGYIISCLGKAKTSGRLGVKSWWGLAKVTPFGAVVVVVVVVFNGI